VSTPNPLHRSARINQEEATRGKEKEKEKEREKAGAEEEKVGTEEEEAEKEAEKVVEEEGEGKVGAVRELRVSGSVNGEEEGK